MTLLDPLSNALVAIQNAEARNKKSCIVAPGSNLIGNVLRVLQKNGYIGEFEFIDDGKSGMFKVQLLGRITRCRSIRPRFSVKHNEYLEWERKLLPAYNVGLIIVSTSKGVMSHREAQQQNLGGRLLAYVY